MQQAKFCLGTYLIGPSMAVRLLREGANDLSSDKTFSSEALDKLHSAQLIFGIIALSLLCISFILSFLVVGNVCERNKLLRVRVHSVKVEDKSKEDTPGMEMFTAVIKMNNETAKNFVLPIKVQELTQDPTASVPACIFEFDAKQVGKISFSFIIRDGNIPIHFETVSGNQFVKGSQAGEGSMRVLEFSTFHENELKLQNKRILLNYDLETK